MEKQFLSTKEAAEFLGWSPSQIEKMTAPNVKVALKETKPLPFYKVGRRIFFDRSELIDYIKGGKVVQMQLPKNEFELLKIPSLLAA